MPKNAGLDKAFDENMADSDNFLAVRSNESPLGM
jgi:hypothetical protein